MEDAENPTTVNRPASAIEKYMEDNEDTVVVGRHTHLPS